MATQITDHTVAALARLPQQFKGKPKLEAFISALVDPIQDIENAMWQLLTERAISTAVGSQLDAIGFIVNQERIGLLDADYRRYLRARIAVNRSDGIDDNLIRIARLLVNDTGALIEIDNQGPATVVVRIRTIAITSAVADLLNVFLQDGAAKSGVRLIVESGTVAESLLFTLDTGPGFGEPASIDLSIFTSNIRTVIIATSTGLHTIALTADGAGAGTLDAGYASVFHYQSGVTTVANFETAIASSGYLAVLLTGGVDTFAAGDAMAPEEFTGGTTGGVMRDARDSSSL